MKKSVVKNHFSEFAADWVQSSYEGDGFLYPTARHRTKVVCSILAALDAPARIVDLGCGGGHLAAALAGMGHAVTGFDQSAEMVGIAENLAAGLDDETRARLAFLCGELENLPAQDAPCDAVTSMGVIGYLDDDAVLFDAANALLKPDGLFLVSCRNRLFNMSSISYRTEREIENAGAWPLLQQIAALSENVSKERVRELAQNLIAAGEEVIKVLDRPEPSTVVTDSDAGPGIEARQHTPDDIRAGAERHGFEMVGLHGVHPHLLPPHLNKSMPPFTYNILSSALESLHDLPASVGWSSVFIAVLRKTG